MVRYAFVKEQMVRPGGVYPKYGAVDRDYYGSEYDGFQDVFTMALYSNLECGRFGLAHDIFDNYFSDFTDSQGMINMRGPETAQFGLTLFLLARYFELTGDKTLMIKHREKIEATAALLAELQDEALKLPAAEVVLATFEHGDPHLASERPGGGRDLLGEQLLLQGLGRGRDHDPTAGRERRQQVGEALAGARARLGDEMLARLERELHRRSERSLLRPRLEADESGGERAARGERLVHGRQGYGCERLSRLFGNAAFARESKKISSDKSEDPPELSAGSSESEDLPDPTGGSYRRGIVRVNPRRAKKSRSLRDFSRAPGAGRRAASERPSPAVGLCLVQDAFGAGGSLAATLPGFAPRPEQAALAEAVAFALASGEHLIAEAGTGTGKSLAYLLPALESGRPSRSRRW